MQNCGYSRRLSPPFGRQQRASAAKPLCHRNKLLPKANAASFLAIPLHLHLPPTPLPLILAPVLLPLPAAMRRKTRAAAAAGNRRGCVLNSWLYVQFNISSYFFQNVSRGSLIGVCKIIQVMSRCDAATHTQAPKPIHL
jgi:hypothetical protein